MLIGGPMVLENSDLRANQDLAALRVRADSQKRRFVATSPATICLFLSTKTTSVFDKAAERESDSRCRANRPRMFRH
jgi:hypothetical protein